jgi:hypothetical protein
VSERAKNEACLLAYVSALSRTSCSLFLFLCFYFLFFLLFTPLHSTSLHFTLSLPSLSTLYPSPSTQHTQQPLSLYLSFLLLSYTNTPTLPPAYTHTTPSSHTMRPLFWSSLVLGLTGALQLASGNHPMHPHPCILSRLFYLFLVPLAILLLSPSRSHNSYYFVLAAISQHYTPLTNNSTTTNPMTHDTHTHTLSLMRSLQCDLRPDPFFSTFPSAD